MHLLHKISLCVNKNDRCSSIRFFGVNIYFNLVKNTLATYGIKKQLDPAVCNLAGFHMLEEKKKKGISPQVFHPYRSIEFIIGCSYLHVLNNFRQSVSRAFCWHISLKSSTTIMKVKFEGTEQHTLNQCYFEVFYFFFFSPSVSYSLVIVTTLL